jgi:flagellar secretion chaperone FliS
MYSNSSLGSPFARPQGQSAAYRQVGVETGVAQASPHHLVQMLFDGLLESIAQAHGAMRQGAIDAKCRALGRAVRIVEEGLKASLDLRGGGVLAQDLADLYAYITLRLTQANLRNDARALDECTSLIQPLREAWLSIAAQVDSRAA